MTEAYIHLRIPGRLAELGYRKYYERHRDFVLEAGATLNIEAYNELYFVVDDPLGVVIESRYGMYDSTEDLLAESVHEHRGEITIMNPGTVSRRVKFIQVIIVS